MHIDEIKFIQERIGVKPDGIWGKKSEAAAEAHLLALMPSPNPWPKKKDIVKFYGEPGTSIIKQDVTGLGMKYRGFEVVHIWVHEKCAGAMLRFIKRIKDSQFAWILEKYAGCYNKRPKRGTEGQVPVQWSNHSWGSAIDFDAPGNPFRAKWPEEANMPFEVMEMAAMEGFVAAGAFWSMDAMHFELIQR